MVYIYALIDPITGTPRYVGKATDLAQRLKAHMNDKSTIRKARWLQSLRAKGLIPTVLVLEVVAADKWQEAEQRWIAIYRFQGIDLTNHTGGGEGLDNASAETRQKLSDLRRKDWADPIRREQLLASLRSKDRCKKISVALTGKSKTPAHIVKLPQNQPGRRLSTTAKANISKGLMGNQYRKGIPHTSETIARLRERSIGNPSRTGMTNSPEMRVRQSLAQKGRPKSPGWRERIRQGQLQAWAIRKGRDQS